MRRIQKTVLASILAATALGCGPTAQANENPGAYLAARLASSEQDYAAAAQYFSQALVADPSNPLLLDSALAAHVGLGEFNEGLPLADALIGLGVESQLGRLTRQVAAAGTEDWDTLIARLDAGEEIGPLVDGLARGWAYMGAGRVSEAIATFDLVIEGRGLRAFGLYHKALALSTVGALDEAEALLSLPPEQGMQRTKRSILTHIEVLSQLDRPDAAIGLIDTAFGETPPARFAELREMLTNGTRIRPSIAPTARHGMAEAYLSVAGALDGETADSYTLIYAQAARALAPSDPDTILLTADLLSRIGQFDGAEAVFRTMDPAAPAFPNAEIGRAEAIREAGRPEAATEVLQALARLRPDLPDVHLNLGNLLRETGDLAAAETSYGAALDQLTPGDRRVWLVHYLRGIARHQQDSWPGAEADFRASLAENPEQPQVLNYLGYSLLERGEKLPEAMDMIERAVAQSPDNGAIVDSLGWGLFLLGQHQEAVQHLERATELEPMEPVINDHLGDAYWAVGRETEARFQWNRALSLAPTEQDAERIRRKLDIGLDAVLAEDGAQPLVTIAEDG